MSDAQLRRLAAPVVLLTAAALLATAGLYAALFAPAAAQDTPDSLPGEVIAVLDNASPGDAERVERFVELAAERGFAARFRHSLAGLGLEMVTLTLPGSVTGPQAIEILETAAPYSTVGVNHVYELAETRAPRLFAKQAIGWPDGSCRVKVNIGVIDTPVRAGALDLPQDGLVSASFLRADERPSDRDHGAAIAGILSGPAGLLTDATLFVAAAVIEDEKGRPRSRVDHLARSINWMAENEVKVVNLSLAGPKNKIFARVVDSAARRGMILVAAAGNAGPGSPPLYPAAFEQVVAVTAVDAARRVYRKAVQGAHIDLAAPGVDVWLAAADRPRYGSGTSLAVPYVAARLAVAAADGALRDVAAARRLLRAEAEDLGDRGRDPVFGDGLLRGPAACR